MAQSIQNFMLSPAAQDLGLGDKLRQETEDEIMKRKKRMMLDPTQNNSASSTALLGSLARPYA